MVVLGGGGLSDNYKLDIFVSNASAQLAYDTGNGASFTLNEDTTFDRVRIVIFSGQTVNNLTFKPMIRMSDISDNTYEPYTNGIPSPNPDYPQDIKVVTGENNIIVRGKNLLDLRNFETTTQSGITLTPVFDDDKLLYIESSGTFSTTPYILLTNNLHLKPNTKYTLSGGYSASARLRLREFNQNGTRLSEYFDSGSGVTFTTNANVATVNIQVIFYAQNNVKFYPQVELGSTPTTYEPYIEPIEKELNLGNIELAKINDYSDLIFKNEKTNPYYDNTLVENAWYKKGVIDKINSYNEESITTDYISTTGGLDNGATVYYVLETLTYTQITNTTLINQLEDLNKIIGQGGTVIIETESEEENAQLIVNASALKSFENA